MSDISQLFFEMEYRTGQEKVAVVHLARKTKISMNIFLYSSLAFLNNYANVGDLKFDFIHLPHYSLNAQLKMSRTFILHNNNAGKLLRNWQKKELSDK